MSLYFSETMIVYFNRLWLLLYIFKNEECDFEKKTIIPEINSLEKYSAIHFLTVTLFDKKIFSKSIN